jgi:hypothetical protein
MSRRIVSDRRNLRQAQVYQGIHSQLPCAGDMRRLQLKAVSILRVSSLSSKLETILADNPGDARRLTIGVHARR